MQSVIDTIYAPYPQVLCPSCYSQYVEPDDEEPPYWNCEECGWTGQPIALLAVADDGSLEEYLPPIE